MVLLCMSTYESFTRYNSDEQRYGLVPFVSLFYLNAYISVSIVQKQCFKTTLKDVCAMHIFVLFTL